MSFYIIDGETKGKKNKLKLGQKVKASRNLVDWFSSHISWLYGVNMHGKNEYSEGEKEIRPESLKGAYAWIHAKLSGKNPTGIVVGYGADSSDEKGQTILGLKNVHVELVFESDLGKTKVVGYFSEKDLISVKKRKK